MWALIHTSSFSNSTVCSLLHTFFHEISLCPSVYIMTMIAFHIYLKKYFFFMIHCHLFAVFSPSLPPSFSSVVTQLLGALLSDAKNDFQELSLVRAFCGEQNLALYMFDPSVSQWEERAKWSMFLCYSWTKKVIEILFVQGQDKSLCNRENMRISCHTYCHYVCLFLCLEEIKQLV